MMDETKNHGAVMSALGVFLNRKLPDWASLKVHGHQLLQSQLEEHALLQQRFENLDANRQAYAAQALKELEEVRGELEQLRLRCRDLRASMLEQTDQSPPWIDELTQQCKTVHQLETLKNYMSLLLEVENQSKIVEQSAASLTVYHRLMDLKKTVDESPFKHLKDAVEARVKQVSDELEKQLSKRLLECAEGLKWPQPKIALPERHFPPEKFALFRAAFQEMIMFQQPFLQIQPETDDWASVVKKLPQLLAIQTLLQPISRRFSYHFEGKRPTNQIDKPEWYLTHVLNLIRDHSVFLANDVQPILNGLGMVIYDAKTEFIRGLIVIVTAKIARDLPKICASPPLLSHTVHELLLFERELRITHSFSHDFKGVLQIVTKNSVIFDLWVKVEEAYSLSVFEDFMKSPKAFELFYNDVGGPAIDTNKPTESAEQLLALLQVITERYRYLPKQDQRLKFFNQIQVKLVQLYTKYLTALPEETWRKSLDELVYWCRRSNSARHLAAVIRQWTEQVIFLEMYQFKSGTDSNVSHLPDAELKNATLWSDCIVSLDSVEDHLLSVMVDSCTRAFSNATSAYNRRRFWASVGSSSSSDSLEIHRDWIEPLAVLKERLILLQKELAIPSFEVFWRRLASYLDNFIMDHLILPNRFDERGALQLDCDMKALFQLFRAFVKKPENYIKRVKEACILLSLPVQPLSPETTTLQAVCESLFNSDWAHEELQAEALHPIGVFRLSVPEAREILLLHVSNKLKL